MKKFFILATILVSVFSLTACLKLSLPSAGNRNVNIEVSDQIQGGQVAIIESNIIVTKPLSNDVVTSPLVITGRAQISGAILFRLKDAWEQVMATSSTMAAAGIPDWGYYSGRLEFPTSLTPTGWLEVYNQNAQDGNEENLIKLPVIFEEYLKPVLKIYFSNTKEDPGMLDCGKVYPVERVVEPTGQLVVAALGELLNGPTEEDKNNGFITSIPQEGIKIQKLEVKDKTLYIDFNQALQEGVAGSCRVIAIRAQIIETLKQFEEIDEVVISIDGRTEDILQP